MRRDYRAAVFAFRERLTELRVSLRAREALDVYVLHNMGWSGTSVRVPHHIDAQLTHIFHESC